MNRFPRNSPYFEGSEFYRNIIIKLYSGDQNFNLKGGIGGFHIGMSVRVTTHYFVPGVRNPWLKLKFDHHFTINNLLLYSIPLI